MENKNTKQPHNWREARRLQAWKLKQKGWKQKDIAEALGVTAGAVSQWMKRVEEGGVEALYHRPGLGAKPRLSQEQQGRLLTLLNQGAEKHGFRGDVWTQPRIARLIQREFAVSYHPRHMGRLLKALGWSNQKPEHRASQRDEVAIETWRTDTWETVKKKRDMKDAR
jgi:transposase